MTDDDGLDQEGAKGGGGKWINPGSSLKVEPIGLPFLPCLFFDLVLEGCNGTGRSSVCFADLLLFFPLLYS